LRGTGERPVAGGRKWAWRSRPRPAGERCPMPSGHGRASPPAMLDASPGGFVLFAPFGGRTPPSPTRRVSGAAGTWQAGVCGGAARPGRAARPNRDADQTPPAEAIAAGIRRDARRSLQPVPAIRAGETLAMIHLDRAGPRAGRGVALQASGSGYGPRAPELTAFRRPKLRAPRPSVGTEGGRIVAWRERVWKKSGMTRRNDRPRVPRPPRRRRARE